MPTVGVLGAGQLGRMLALEGMPLGFDFRFYDPGGGEPVHGLGVHDRAEWDDDAAIDAFRDAVDVVTWEFENVPVALVERLRETVPVFPSAKGLATAQDRWVEKTTFERIGIPTNGFRNVESAADLRAAIADLGLPAVLKTRRFGYDGKGQAVLGLDGADVDADAVFADLGSVPCIYEAFVDFEREVSLVGVRGRDGDTRFYPLVENVHVNGILRRTTAPAPAPRPENEEAAHDYMSRLFDELGYVGALAIEFFVTPDGLLANEIAPRVHNSGHWTQDGAVTSQFENHVRAVTGLPLGDTSVPAHTVMVNLIGDVPTDLRPVLELEGRVHLYGKSSRPGRKVGHVNVTGADPAEVAARADRIEALSPIV